MACLLSDIQRVPAWQAKWVARVLSGRAPPLPDCAMLLAEAAAFYALLERAGVPVRYTHRQARAAHTAACMLDLMQPCMQWQARAPLPA